jgi:hypothetical protein
LIEGAAVVALGLAACAHGAGEAESATSRRCAELRAEVERDVAKYEEARRACDVYSRETFNRRDCLVARGFPPEAPPPGLVEDGPDCPDRASWPRPARRP